MATAAIAAAVAAAAPEVALAGFTDGTPDTNPGREFVISTSGATALSAFTRGVDTTTSTLNRGPYSLGQDSLTIGDTTYTLDAGGQRLGRALRNAPLANEPPLTADRLVYTYHEIGSINGVNDVAAAGGLINPPPTNFPFAITSSNPFFVQGLRLNAAPAVGTTLANGYTFSGQLPTRIAYSDVRAEQAFSVPGTAAFDRRPTEAGYGLGPGVVTSAPSGTPAANNQQSLTSSVNLAGGTNPATTRLRNEDLAVVPFTVSANPGTGLARLSESDALFLNAAGRLENGANFNFATRDIGSGTRNQAGNNLGLDPSFAVGERDRRNADGTERNPFSRTLNDDRPSAEATFADKTSGSSQVRISIVGSRMALGVLSSGDVGSRGRTANTAEPLRVLAVDFVEAPGEAASATSGFVQPTLRNVVDGKYQLFSAAQAVTVAPYANPAANDTAAADGRPIVGDTIDNAADGIGVHRKFLDNIRASIANFGDPETNQTPFDAIAAASFIPTQVLGVSKQFDGDVQQARTRSASEQAALDTLLAQNANSSSTLVGALNFLDPSVQNGNLADTSTRYNIYAPGNTLASSNANADLSIDINARTVLAGDFDGNGVRDLDDVPALALAVASPSAYLATPAGDPDAGNYNGVAVAALQSATLRRAGNFLSFTPGQEGLVVLSDLDGDGNVTATGSTTGSIASIERDDVRYFLYGASVDTSTYVGDDGSVVTSPTAQQRREDGVRLGQLRKNAAIDTYNAELTSLGVAAGSPLRFDKFDADQDDARSLEDARIVDRNLGRDFTVLSDVLGTADDLIAAEFDDDNVVNRVDFDLLAFDFFDTGDLLRGDVNFDGFTDGSDVVVILNNFGFEGDDPLLVPFSTGDISDGAEGLNDGFVDANDLVTALNDFGNESGFFAAFDTFEALNLSEFNVAVVDQTFVAVPEPTTAGVLAGAAGLLLARRRRVAR